MSMRPAEYTSPWTWAMVILRRFRQRSVFWKKWCHSRYLRDIRRTLTDTTTVRSIVLSGPAADLASEVGSLEQAYLGAVEDVAEARAVPAPVSANGQHPDPA